jgi:endonuclease-3
MKTLVSVHRIVDWSRGLSAFEILVSTILSQSTTVANERRGMDGLRDAFGAVTPERLAQASEEDIARAIWHAGLSRQKAPWIRQMAERLASPAGPSLETVLRQPIPEAREALRALPGVGPKTADVVLAMGAHRPVFPVDTHVARIARRWKLIRTTRYEAIRHALERWTQEEERRSWHLAMVVHGRTLCKARSPRCGTCPVARDCDWYLARRGRRPDKRLKGRYR